MKVEEIIILSSVLIMASTSCSAQENPSQKGKKQGPPNIDQLLEKMDANKDGKLSYEEVKGPLKKDFETIDTNKDSFLSREELEAAPKPKKGKRSPK